MNILRLFGIGSAAILAKDCCVKGKVTKVSRCWWLKINTKPVRRFSGDGAVSPSVITFDYQVDNLPYVGNLYIPIRCRVPQVGETIAYTTHPKSQRTMPASPSAREINYKTEKTIC